MDNSYTDKILISLISAGDEHAFHKFFDRYKHRLFVFVEGLIHSKADAEEIVQETFIKVWQSSHLLRNIEQPGHYVYTIARNKTLNYIKKAARDQKFINQVFANQQDIDESIEEKLRTDECKMLIDQGIGQLNDQQQRIFRMSRDQYMTHEMIAEHLGLSKSRVKNIMVEVLKQLKVFLQEHSDLLYFFWLITATFFL